MGVIQMRYQALFGKDPQLAVDDARKLCGAAYLVIAIFTAQVHIALMLMQLRAHGHRNHHNPLAVDLHFIREQHIGQVQLLGIVG